MLITTFSRWTTIIEMYILDNMLLPNHRTFNVLCESVDSNTKQQCNILKSNLCTYSGSMD